MTNLVMVDCPCSYSSGTDFTTLPQENSMNVILMGVFSECTCFYSIGVDCNTPKQLHGGTVSYDGTGYNMVVSYKCDEGYSLIGSSRRVCQSSGKWSGEEPFCERKNIAVV